MSFGVGQDIDPRLINVASIAFAKGMTMVILARIKVRPVKSEAEPEPLRRVPEIQWRSGDKEDVLLHAALMERLGFTTPKIRKLLKDHPPKETVPQLHSQDDEA